MEILRLALIYSLVIHYDVTARTAIFGGDHFIPSHSLGMTQHCQERYFSQRINHFGGPPQGGTFQQRYFVHDDHYTPGGPMFFYLGNEADVTLYVNATGLMWEHSSDFGALIVFAEHRYYGKSKVLNNTELQYLSVEQALMDYVTLVDFLKKSYAFDRERDAVIGFGGSYGGMLASWARFKYPNVWDGVIAASAPILSFEFDDFEYDYDFFAQGLTYDVTTAAGVGSRFCEANLRQLFASDNNDNNRLENISLAQIRSSFGICSDDNTTDDNLRGTVTGWVNEALSYMAMGNFPYPSSYILNGKGELPAFPIRVACEYLGEDFLASETKWLEGLASFAGVYYNYTKTLSCNILSEPVNKEAQIVGALWDYQYCSQIFQVFSERTSSKDMFSNNPWNGDNVAEDCYERHGFYPDRYHFPLAYGSPHDWIHTGVSNIVWSQGEYDPWKGGGVVENLTESLRTVVIAEAAHHLDLFFSHPNDTNAVIEARLIELNEIKKWIHEKKKRPMPLQAAAALQKRLR
eukprot:CAMPEP_0194206434 /NCGR_PEP_ID=MMETSP0156-20130528/5473_1 /TAXON_ID=33649 /ORGANISM="Thalassionema nitzschioides, Strain L26-B" /LENGTH=518 /DNA_ID=CAMNT_0038932961 /DNA_START=145 /DNA_END=1701 /DNA_ORIENTATION=-